MKKLLPESNERTLMIFSDEDLDEIKRLSALNLDLRSIAINLKIDPDRFAEEYHRPGSILRHIIDEAETSADIDLKQKTSDRAKDPADHEAARQRRTDALQARWDRYRSKLLFDKQLGEAEALQMAIEHGAGKLSGEMKDRFEKLDFIRSLYTQMNSRSYIISAVRIKWPEITWSVARNLYYESLNFFNCDQKVSREVWANAYADQLDQIAAMAFETGQLDIAGKYKLEAAKLRGVGKEDPPQLPPEIFDRRPIIYSLRISDFGIQPANRNELAEMIDGLDIAEKDKARLRREAMITSPIEFFLEEDSEISNEQQGTNNINI